MNKLRVWHPPLQFSFTLTLERLELCTGINMFHLPVQIAKIAQLWCKENIRHLVLKIYTH